MDFMSPLLLIFVIFSLVGALFLLLLHHGHGRKGSTPNNKDRLPPGPPALVFLAKFLALRRSIFDLEPVLLELHARHGPVISIRLFRTLVFIADRHLAHRVLVQGGATFADRRPLFEPGSLFTAGSRQIATSPYGPYWRLVRRNLAVEALHPARVSLFAPGRRRAGEALVADLLLASARGGGDGSSSLAVELRPWLRRALFDLFVYTCFGARLGGEALDEIQELQKQVLRGITGFPVFAFFPKWLFRGRWQSYVALRRRQLHIYLPLIHAAKRGDDDPPCYADSLLKLRVADEGERPLTDDEMVSLCSEFLSGGTDSTVTIVEWIMAELVNHPDVQAKVHEEVKSKPLDLDESSNLHAMPYLKAVVMEGLRLHPPGHFVLPHVGGYTVPKGAQVNFLVAKIGRDETTWTAPPLEFRPERFLDGGEGCDVDITGSREIKMMPFGAGRRMCPGHALGMLNVEFLVGSLVRDLEWLPPMDGEAIDMTEMQDFTVVMKNPLQARIIPRS